MVTKPASPHPVALPVLIGAVCVAVAAAAFGGWDTATVRAPSGANYGGAMLSAFAALVLAVGLVPCGAVAGAGFARDQAGAARFVAGLLGAAAGLGLAALTFFCVIALMESLARTPARPFLPLLMPLPFVLAGACGWVALGRVSKGVGRSKGVLLGAGLAAVVIFAAGVFAFRGLAF